MISTDAAAQELLFVLAGVGIIGAGVVAFALYRLLWWTCHLVKEFLRPTTFDELLAAISEPPPNTRWH